MRPHDSGKLIELPWMRSLHCAQVLKADVQSQCFAGQLKPRRKCGSAIGPSTGPICVNSCWETRNREVCQARLGNVRRYAQLLSGIIRRFDAARGAAGEHRQWIAFTHSIFETEHDRCWQRTEGRQQGNSLLRYYSWWRPLRHCPKRICTSFSKRRFKFYIFKLECCSFSSNKSHRKEAFLPLPLRLFTERSFKRRNTQYRPCNILCKKTTTNVCSSHLLSSKPRHC